VISAQYARCAAERYTPVRQTAVVEVTHVYLSVCVCVGMQV
jgi:hypothetical protein